MVLIDLAKKFPSPSVSCLVFVFVLQSYGMKCLGIPNTKHFLNITAIADAMECTSSRARVQCGDVPTTHHLSTCVCACLCVVRVSL